MTRLARLEAMRAEKRIPFANVVLIGVLDHNDCNIVGAVADGPVVARAKNETLDDFTDRASRQLGMQFMFAVYNDGSHAG